MKLLQCAVFGLFLAVNAQNVCHAEEESEFSKEFQRILARDAVNFLYDAFKSAGKTDSMNMPFTKPFLTPWVGPTSQMVLGFDLEFERLSNKSGLHLFELSLNLWSCPGKYSGGTIDGELIGCLELNDDLAPDYGYSNLKRTFMIDRDKALRLQSLNGPRVLVVTVNGKEPGSDKNPIRGWSNFSAYDFVHEAWVK